MTDLLIRGCDAETKRALAVQAARNGRSQQAEALAILREALLSEPRSWVDMVLENSRSVGGMEFELPRRHAPRFTAVEL